jgi:serine protease Do
MNSNVAKRFQQFRNFCFLPGVLPHVTSRIIATLLLPCALLAGAPAAEVNRDSSIDPENIADLAWIQDKVRSVFEASNAATVGVGYGGSGVIVTSDGYVLSAAHVTMRAGQKITVTLSDGRKVKAETLGSFGIADAGMLKILDEGYFPHVPLAPEGKSKAGHWCFSLGHASGFDKERGAVLRVGRIVAKLRNVIQTDCHIIGGDSGGPLFNLDGEVIGIHSRVTGNAIEESFHAPVESFHRNWAKLTEGETIFAYNPSRRRTTLSISMEPDENGIRIGRIYGDSPVKAAGLEPGDVITKIDDYIVEMSEELYTAIGSKEPGDSVRLSVLRGKEKLEVDVELAKRWSRGRGRR